MKTSRKTSGFTLMETLVAVAILVILMGFGFVALFQHQKDLKQLELDKTAREIYVAAQNHLTMAKSQELLAKKTKKGTEGTDPQTGDTVWFYYVNGRTNVELDGDSESVLYEMLPYASIDETVRRSGYYAIKYNLDTAEILEVFYTDLGRLSASSITSDPNPFEEYSGEGNKAKRQNYNSGIIGWYGGEGLSPREIKNYANPKLVVKNAERLTATISYPSENFNDDDYRDASIRLCVMSAKNKIPHVVPKFDLSLSEINLDNSSPNKTINGSNIEYRFVLDDITSPNGRFADVFKDADDLIPGEDIILYAEVYSNTVLSNIARSSSVKTNSLFASTYTDKTDITDPKTVMRIANIRHFENMNADVSGYSVDRLGDTSATLFEQTDNLIWSSGSFEPGKMGFIEAIRGESSNADDVHIYREGNEKATTNSFLPVMSSEDECTVTSYNGMGLSISNVVVQEEESNAGLFGVLEDASISNLDLINFKVAGTTDTAGALAGSMTNCKISGVLAYNEKQGDSGDAGLSISGSKSTGGLVGKADSCEFEYCGAAVYVKASGESAGGLIGESTGTTKISYSYSGGHTNDGKYEDAEEGVGRYNVQARSGVAGGLVGVAGDSVTVNSCYSTCSVLGKTAGGLIGSLGSSAVSKSYATGIVTGSGEEQPVQPVGAFIGSLTASGVGTNNKYLSIANGEMPAVGDKPDLTTIADGSENITVYESFAPYDSDARRYDATLSEKFLYRTIKRLAEDEDGDAESVPDRLTIHHGDWQDYATLVVNTPTGGTTE